MIELASTTAPIITDPAVVLAAAQAARAAQDAAINAEWYAFLTLMVQTLGGLGLAWMAFKTAQVTASQKAMSETVHTLEKNTNSIKDALVKSVGEAEFAKGLKEGAESKT